MKTKRARSVKALHGTASFETGNNSGGGVYLKARTTTGYEVWWFSADAARSLAELLTASADSAERAEAEREARLLVARALEGGSR